MRKLVVKVVSSIMLFVFFLGIAPKEYIHDALFHHHDTVERQYKPGEIVFDNVHVHCLFLTFVLAPFTHTEPQFFSLGESLTHAVTYVLPYYRFRYASFHTVSSLRGPPLQ